MIYEFFSQKWQFSLKNEISGNSAFLFSYQYIWSDVKFVIHNEQEPGERFAVNYTPKKGFNDDTTKISGYPVRPSWKIIKTQKIKDRSGNVRWESKTNYKG